MASRGSHLPQLIECKGDFAAAAIEESCISIVVVERSQSRKRRWDAFPVDRESFRVEANFIERAGGA